LQFAQQTSTFFAAFRSAEVFIEDVVALQLPLKLMQKKKHTITCRAAVQFLPLKITQKN